MNKKDIAAVVFLIISLIVYSFLVSALGFWLITLVFPVAFSWPRALVVWVVLVLITGGAKININNS